MWTSRIIATGPRGGLRLMIRPRSLDVLRQSVLQGRDGLGMINVYASGNDAGPQFTNGFPSLGDYSSSSYNPIVNSRYTIGVTGVDHDGMYANADGTFTYYPEAGASVLVAAPTGSSIPAQTISGPIRAMEAAFGRPTWWEISGSTPRRCRTAPTPTQPAIHCPIRITRRGSTALRRRHRWSAA